MDFRSVKKVLCVFREYRRLDSRLRGNDRKGRRDDMVDCQSGFTLVELLIYAVIFTIASGLLTGILVTISSVQTKENAAFEVTRQLQFVTQRIQYAIRDASIVDIVYEGSDPGTPCTSHCSVRLRVSDPALDPTIISSDINGVYMKEGDNPQVTITSPNIKITSLVFDKIGNPGGLSTITMTVALVYNTPDPTLQIAKTLSSAIAHVSAATFDTDLLPDSSESRSIGGSSLKWKDLTVSNGVTVSGAAGVGEFAGFTMQKSTTHGSSSINQYYVTSTPYDKYGARFDVGGTPMLYLEGDINQSGRRAYFLNGNVGIGTSEQKEKNETGYVGTKFHVLASGGTGDREVARFEGGSDADNTAAIVRINHSNDRGIYLRGGRRISDSSFGEIGIIQTNGILDSAAITINDSGNVGIGNIDPGSNKLYVNGAAYFSADVSALSFTDRTPYPENVGIAYAAVMSMSRLPDGEYDPENKENQLDHSTLTDFVTGNDGNRDLSATVSAQNEVIKDLIRRIEELEGR